MLFLRWITNKRLLHAIYKSEEHQMAAINDLIEAVNALTQEDTLVIEALTGLNQKVADLTAALAAATNVDPQIEQAAQAVQAEVAKLQAAVIPPPAPVV